MVRLRLDKLLTHQRIGSRREVNAKIRAGHVQVNGCVCNDAAKKVDTEQDLVLCDGVPIHYEAHRYYMLHKPRDVVSATKDNLHETVLSLFPQEEREGLFPVGRLDIDTEGLLLLTDDGAFSHRITSPRYHVEKEYYARVTGILKPDATQQFASGMQLTSGECFESAKLKIILKSEITEVSVILSEGQFHQVKKMIEAVGGKVCYLKRVRIGRLFLDPSLSQGEYRKLSTDEINTIWN